MKKTVYLIKVEGVNFPSFFIDAKRFNRLVYLATSFDKVVRVIGISPYAELITNDDLATYAQMVNFFKTHK